MIGNEDQTPKALQRILDQATHDLNYELPSRAEGCAGRPPVVAHPGLLQPRRPFRPEQELAQFDLTRVDAYLATLTWRRIVDANGCAQLGGKRSRYSVGRAYARRELGIRFDPTDRHFVFSEVDASEQAIKRLPTKGGEIGDLTGLATWPMGLGLQQLPLLLCLSQG